MQIETLDPRVLDGRLQREMLAPASFRKHAELGLVRTAIPCTGIATFLKLESLEELRPEAAPKASSWYIRPCRVKYPGTDL